MTQQFPAVAPPPAILGPGRKFDTGKLRFDLIPTQVLSSLARVLTYGANKYDANNWQNVQPFHDRYYAALMRHLEAWRSGQDRDEESGLLHLEHALCCAAFLCWDAVVRPRAPK